jgi:hypothetical protein
MLLTASNMLLTASNRLLTASNICYLLLPTMLLTASNICYLLLPTICYLLLVTYVTYIDINIFLEVLTSHGYDTASVCHREPTFRGNAVSSSSVVYRYIITSRAYEPSKKALRSF